MLKLSESPENLRRAKDNSASKGAIYGILIVPTITASGWWIVSVFANATIGRFSILSICLGLALTFWSLRTLRKSNRTLPASLVLSVSCSGFFWMSTLDFLTQYWSVDALTLLLVMAATVMYATVAFATIESVHSTGARRIKEIGFALSVFAIFLCAVEGMLGVAFPSKLWAPVPDNPDFGPHIIRTQDGRWVGNPGFKGQFVHPEFAGIRVEINQYGLRDDPEEASPPEENEVSILVLGDSFAFGTGVSLGDTFQERLETAGSLITNRPLRVYGAGMPGYGTYHEWQFLRQLAPLTRPNVVIVAVFEENDFLDNWDALRLAKQKVGSGNALSPTATVSNQRQFFKSVFGFKFWYGNSAIAQVCKLRLKLLLFKIGLLNSVSLDFFRDKYLLTRPPKVVDDAVKLVVQKLGDIRRECDTLSASLIVMIIPSIHQVDPSRFEEFLSLKAPEERSEFSRTALHRRFVERLSRDDFTVLDMLPHLESSEAAGKSCYHQEGHWNAQGHALASLQLAPLLASLLKKTDNE